MGESVGVELERDRGGDPIDRLRRVRDHHEPNRSGGDDLLAGVGAAAAFDQPAVGRDLVSAVDRDVQGLDVPEVLDGDPELAGGLLGGGRAGDAAEVLELSLGERRQQVGDRRAGAEAHLHPALDQEGGLLRGDALLGLWIRFLAHGSGKSMPED
jgi:hypothetical protein